MGIKGDHSLSVCTLESRSLFAVWPAVLVNIEGSIRQDITKPDNERWLLVDLQEDCIHLLLLQHGRQVAVMLNPHTTTAIVP